MTQNNDDTDNNPADDACAIVYSLSKATKGSTSFSDFTIATLNTPSTGDSNSIDIYSDDDTEIGNFTLKIVAAVDPAMGGVSSQEVEFEGWLEIRSMCDLAIWSSSADQTGDYFIREPLKTFTIPRFSVAWVDATYSMADLIGICGDIEYHLFEDTGDVSTYQYDSYEASVFQIDTASDSSNVLIKAQSSNPLMAGGSIGNPTTEYPMVIMAQMGSHFYNRDYVKLAVTAKDFCWNSQIRETVPIEDQ